MNILDYYKSPATWICSSLPLCPDRVQSLPEAVAIYSKDKQRLSIREMNHSIAAQPMVGFAEVIIGNSLAVGLM